MPLVQSHLDVGRRTFERAVVCAAFHLAGPHSSGHLGNSTFVGGMQVRIAAGADFRPADGYSQGMTLAVLVE